MIAMRDIVPVVFAVRMGVIAGCVLILGMSFYLAYTRARWSMSKHQAARFIALALAAGGFAVQTIERIGYEAGTVLVLKVLFVGFGLYGLQGVVRLRMAQRTRT